MYLLKSVFRCGIISCLVAVCFIFVFSGCKNPLEKPFKTEDLIKTLDSINISAGEITPSFNPAINDYYVIVPNNITSFTVTPYPGGTALVSGNTSVSSLLVGTAMTITLTVTPRKGTPNVYTFTVCRRPSIPTVTKKTAGANKIDFSWSGDAGVVYEVSFYPDGAPGEIQSLPPGQINPLGTTISGLVNDVVYVIQIRAGFNYGNPTPGIVYGEYGYASAMLKNNVSTLNTLTLSGGIFAGAPRVIAESEFAGNAKTLLLDYNAGGTSFTVAASPDDLLGASAAFRRESDSGFAAGNNTVAINPGGTTVVIIRITAQNGTDYSDYALTVSMKDKITIGISGPGEADIVFNPVSAALGIKLSRSGLGLAPAVMTVQISGSSFTGIVWYVDGKLAGTGTAITLYAADYDIRVHRLSVVAEYNGAPYSRTIDFEVTE